MDDAEQQPSDADVTPEPIRVAILYDPVKLEEGEVGYPSPALQNVLDATSDISSSDIALASLLAGGLDGYTCLCVPGGFAPNYASRLGTQGFRIIREFVAAGGGFVGLCAGAYLGSSQGIGLLPVDCVDVHRWARGSGPCQLHFTEDGHRLLGAAAPLDRDGDAAQPVTVRYANGPLMRIAGPAATLATFATEFRELHAGHRYGSRIEGSPAVVLGRASGLRAEQPGGVVALASPHIEDGDDARALTPFANMLRLASRGSFYQRWIEESWGQLGAECT